MDPELPGSRIQNDFPGPGSDRIHNAASGVGGGTKFDMKLAQEIHTGRQKKLSNPGAPTNYTELLISENFPRSSFKQCNPNDREGSCPVHDSTVRYTVQYTAGFRIRIHLIRIRIRIQIFEPESGSQNLMTKNLKKFTVEKKN